MKELSPEAKEELAEQYFKKAMWRTEKLEKLRTAAVLIENRPGKTLQILADMDCPADPSFSNEELHAHIAHLMIEVHNAPEPMTDIQPAERLAQIRARLTRNYSRLLHTFSEEDVQILATIPGAEDLEASELRVPTFLYKQMGVFCTQTEIKEKTSCDNSQVQTAVAKLKPFLHPLRGGLVLEEKEENRTVLYRLVKPKTEEEKQAQEQQKKEEPEGIRFTIDWNSPKNLTKTT